MPLHPEHVIDQLLIERLHYDYAWAADRPGSADAAAVASFFTPDARWEAPDHGQVCLGRAEIEKQFSNLAFMAPSHHFMTNLRIDIAPDGLTASATAYLLNYSRMNLEPGEAEPRLVTRASRYATTCVKVGDSWLFESLAIVFQYGDPLKA